MSIQIIIYQEFFSLFYSTLKVYPCLIADHIDIGKLIADINMNVIIRRRLMFSIRHQCSSYHTF